ncbi:hypothetical protein ABHI18_004394 [Aspergillus niger]
MREITFREFIQAQLLQILDPFSLHQGPIGNRDSFHTGPLTNRD